MPFNLRSIVGVVAPTVASLLGGPLAGTAVRALSELLLGKPDGTEDEVAQQLQSADPATLLKLKELDATFKTQMRQLDVDLEKIAAEDRSNARARQAQTRDAIPGIIAMAVLLGFFGLLALMIFQPFPASAEAPLNVMLGALGAMVTAIAQFYFGSSASSRSKDATIATMQANGVH